MIKKIKRDNQTCYQVQHSGPVRGPRDKPAGTPIKTYCGPDAKKNALALHRAIMASKAKRGD